MSRDDFESERISGERERERERERETERDRERQKLSPEASE